MLMLGVCKFVVSTVQQVLGDSRRRPCCHVTQEHVQLVNICLLMHSGGFRQLQLFVAGYRSTAQRRRWPKRRWPKRHHFQQLSWMSKQNAGSDQTWF